MKGINIALVPPEGFLIAYFRDALVFEPYTITAGELSFPDCERYQDSVPEECHLFDRDTEYRTIRREARGDRIELVLRQSDEEGMDPDLLFTEDILVKEAFARKGTLPKSLKIISRYRYSENDTLVLKNYRISY